MIVFNCIVIALVLIAEIFVFTAILDRESAMPIFDYQNLIAGLLAMIAAGCTVFMMWRQIKQQDKHFEHVRYRKSYAARSVMPAALASLIVHAQEAVIVGVKMRACVDGPSNGEKPSFEMPDIPRDIISTLKECVEFADDANSKRISDMLSTLQVLTSYLQEYGATISKPEGHDGVLQCISSHNIDDGIILKAGKLYALAASLFKYANRETDASPPNIDRQCMCSAFLNLKIRSNRYPYIYAEINKQYPN